MASWVGTISERATEKPGESFKMEELRNQKDLFSHRAALYFTPTSEIPEEWILQDPLEITLPLVTPDYNEFMETKTFRTPRLWVDLIQRSTFKIRAHPLPRAKLIYTRYDYNKIRPDHLLAGTKALTDALKVNTTGRKDRKILYYFGAIEDDTYDHIEIECRQELVEHPDQCKLNLVVQAL